MKHTTAAFAALTLAAALAPAIATAQQAEQKPDPAFAEGVLKGQFAVSACTSDGFTEEGAVLVVVSASDVKKLGNGNLQAGTEKLDLKAIQAELAKEWKAFSAEMTSTDLAGDEPSAKVQKSLETHLKAFAAAETKATGVHFDIASVRMATPTPGCKP